MQYIRKKISCLITKRKVSCLRMNPKTKNQESREQENQRLLATMKEALKKQKTKSNRLARGQITSSHVKQLNQLYTKGSAAFGSINNLRKASCLPKSKLIQYLQSKATYIKKYKQLKKTFPRLKVVAYGINENLVCRCGVYGQSCATQQWSQIFTGGC